jgi:ABC-2 type transport system ATP-binding protein
MMIRMGMNMITVNNLHKHYGDVHAVDGISFEIQQGEVFGLLGPNGAGKSTTINVLCTYAEPTAGEVIVAGHSVTAEPETVKRAIGVVPQDIALYPSLNALENLRFFGRLYEVPRARLEQRIADLLHLVGLTEQASKRVEHYSGGMKRRLNLAVGLLSEPLFLMLDEPTVGVDPQSRHAIFENIQALNRQGLTVLYTTHYMEEAELLCHRVAIVDAGRVIALDTPQNLINSLGTGIIRIGVRDEEGKEHPVSDEMLARLQALPQVKTVVHRDKTLVFETTDAQRALLQIIGLFNETDTPMASLEILKPNLESVFIQLTGKRLRD